VPRHRTARTAVLGVNVRRPVTGKSPSRTSSAFRRRLVVGGLVVLAGGGALLQGLDERLRHETQMPVHLAESPLTCVAVGSGRSLEEFEAIHRSERSRKRRNGSRR